MSSIINQLRSKLPDEESLKEQWKSLLGSDSYSHLEEYEQWASCGIIGSDEICSHFVRFEREGWHVIQVVNEETSIERPLRPTPDIDYPKYTFTHFYIEPDQIWNGGQPGANYTRKFTEALFDTPGCMELPQSTSDVKTITEEIARTLIYHPSVDPIKVRDDNTYWEYLEMYGLDKRDFV